MPHVVVTGARPLAELVAGFEPLRARVEDAIVKVEQAYLERGGRSALFSALTVSGELRQHFLVLAAARDGDVTVRLHALTDPERTRAVQLAIALVARWVRGASPGSAFGATNLREALEALERQ